MLNKEEHKLMMGRILQDIYSNKVISPLLGFKGGTCALIFYGLPRFSVDLDFDLFDNKKTMQEKVYKEILKIIEKYGTVKDNHIKRYTVFALLSYGETDRNIKIEINTREFGFPFREYYELNDYLGIPMLIAQKEYMFASKLTALTTRSQTAMRDIYDIHYFASNNWDIEEEVIVERTGKSLKNYIPECISVVESISENEILSGLGELVDEKTKAWVKNNLKKETILLLKNYISALSWT